MDETRSCLTIPVKRTVSEAKRKAVLCLLTLYLLRKRMGGFLDKPKTEKSRTHGQGNGLKYGVVSMQGWRVEMEDSHSAVIGLPGDLTGEDTCEFVWINSNFFGQIWLISMKVEEFDIYRFVWDGFAGLIVEIGWLKRGLRFFSSWITEFEWFWLISVFPRFARNWKIEFFLLFCTFECI